ncbi:hypothetical protein [Aureimonas pseudogalii]|uniref:Uncharacterized protein n=1 Tax=Aureimonas pseudogalii TaxID=1744844 RepID=A0A7W6H301_9HYPH|nr:hypothetical protein [Aureimonas pseudogalii]MBB3997205.1 hypothetical protein [Aureimonas pseudogalii]
MSGEMRIILGANAGLDCDHERFVLAIPDGSPLSISDRTWVARRMMQRDRSLSPAALRSAVEQYERELMEAA